MTENDQQAQFTIKDDGVGISKEDQEHLFELFYLADSGFAREADRLGIGLFMSKKIIEMHGGKIGVESEKGKGSTFFVSLPRTIYDRE